MRRNYHVAITAQAGTKNDNDARIVISTGPRRRRVPIMDLTVAQLVAVAQFRGGRVGK